MKLERLVQGVEAGLFRIGRTLLQAGEKADLQEELDLAQADLSRRKADLARAEARRAEVVARIAANKSATAQLQEQIESSFRRGKSSQALRQALELERLRREIADDEARLPRVEQTVWSLNFHLRQLERRLTRLREQLEC